MKSHKATALIVLFVLAAAIWLSCSDDDNGTDPQNSKPIITSITADPDTIYEGGNTTIVTVEAEDPDGDPLTYFWGDDGNLEALPGAAGNTKRFQSCCDVGEPIDCVVYSTVKDGRGGEAHDSVHVHVLPLEEP